MNFNVFMNEMFSDIEKDSKTYLDNDLGILLDTIDELVDEDESQEEILTTIDELEWEIQRAAYENIREFIANRLLVRYFNDGNAVLKYILEEFSNSDVESKITEATSYTSIEDVYADLNSDDRKVRDEATNELLNVVYYMMIDVDFLTSYPEAERIAYEYATEVTSAAVEKLKSENVLSENVVF